MKGGRGKRKWVGHIGQHYIGQWWTKREAWEAVLSYMNLLWSLARFTHLIPEGCRVPRDRPTTEAAWLRRYPIAVSPPRGSCPSRSVRKNGRKYVVQDGGKQPSFNTVVEAERYADHREVERRGVLRALPYLNRREEWDAIARAVVAAASKGLSSLDALPACPEREAELTTTTQADSPATVGMSGEAERTTRAPP